MTIEEAIKHAELKSNGTCVCRDYHRQVAEWLKELKDLREVTQNLVQPIPIVRDDDGKLVKDYTWLDWLAKLNEELDEVKYAVYEIEDKCFDSTFDEDEGMHNTALKLQNLITICVSMQEMYLCYGEDIRNDICVEVNKKNKERGYFNEE